MRTEDLSGLEQALCEGAAELTSRRGASRHRGDPEGSESSESTLCRLTAVAVGSVPGAVYAGLTMRDGDGGLVSRAPSDDAIVDLDRLQADLGEGPCVDALDPGTSTVTRVDDFAAEQRWPRFAPAAVEFGVSSLLSYALAPHDAPPGAINFYGTTRGGFDDQLARTVAAAFAMQAAVSVYGARRVAELERGLATRDVIGQAKGVLMERFHLDDVQAFDLLVRSSQDTNIKLVDVARWMVQETLQRQLDGVAASGAPPARSADGANGRRP